MRKRGIRRNRVLHWSDSHYLKLSTWLGEVKLTYLT